MSSGLIRLDLLDRDAIKLSARLRDVPGGLRRVVAVGLNRGIAAARTKAVAIVREEYNVKARDMRDTMSIWRASATKLVATLAIRHTAAVRLSHFLHGRFAKRKPPVGRSVLVKRAGGPKVVKGSFIFHPKTKGGGRSGKVVLARRTDLSDNRAPIEVLYTASFIAPLRRDVNQRRMGRAAQKRMAAEMERYAARLLS